MADIHTACQSGDLSLVRALVDEKPELVDDDDKHDWRPLFHAALHKRLEIVRLLLEQGADVSAHKGYVLHYAAEVPDSQEIVTLLIQYGALDAHVRPANDLSRQFLAAIFLNDVARVRSLLRLHSELAVQPDGLGDEPIHHAARNGSTEIVRVLLEAGASVNSSNSRGHTVLYCAAGHGHIETSQMLLEHDVDVDAVFTKDGKSVPEWLDQFPDHKALQRIRIMLIQHKEEN